MMMYTRLIKIERELNGIRKDLLDNSFPDTYSTIAECVLAGIPAIIQLIRKLDTDGYSDSVYEKVYAVDDSFISLVDGTTLP